MNKLFLIVIGVSFFHISAFAESTSKITFPGLNIAQQNGHITFVGHTLDNEPGYPKLPIVLYTFLLPPDADLSTVTFHVDGLEEQIQKVTSPIEPASPPIYNNERMWPANRTIVNGKAVEVYENNQFYPNSHVNIIAKGMLHCFKLVQVRVHLCRYNPVQGIIRSVKNGTIIVSVSRNKNQSPILYPVPQKMKKFAERLAVNYSDAMQEYTSKVGFTDTATYAIMIEENIKESSTKLTDFIASKEERGLNVMVLTESDWGGGSGETASENIREWLKDNYEEMSIAYVLLIGDPIPSNGAVPMRHDNRASPTDYYYKDLSNTWPDKDGFAEVSVGRIPVYDESGIETLDKILERTTTYENQPIAETEWRKNALFAAAPFDNSAKGSKLFEEIKEKYVDPSDWKCYRIYDDNEGDPDESNCTEPAVAAAWEANPYGLMEWHTHGSSTSGSDIMSVSTAEDFDDQYPSFVHMGSCSNGKIETENNLTYTMLAHQAVGAIGATRMTWYDSYNGSWEGNTAIQGMIFMTGKGMIGDSLSMGDALIQGVADSDLEHWGNIFSFNLYGDPEVGIYSVKDPIAIQPDLSGITPKMGELKILSSLAGQRGVILQVPIPEGKYRVTIYNISGKEITTLAQGTAYSRKIHSFSWSGLDKNGTFCGNGTYIFKVTCTTENKTIKTPVIW